MHDGSGYECILYDAYNDKPMRICTYIHQAINDTMMDCLVKQKNISPGSVM